jgi:hypothetical protein
VPFRAEKADPGWDISRGGVDFEYQAVVAGAGEGVQASRGAGTDAHFSLASAGCLAQDNDKPVHTERLATGGADLPV